MPQNLTSFGPESAEPKTDEGAVQHSETGVHSSSEFEYSYYTRKIIICTFKLYSYVYPSDGTFKLVVHVLECTSFLTIVEYESGGVRRVEEEVKSKPVPSSLSVGED